MAYYAEVDQNNQVLRVVLAPSIAWVNANVNVENSSWIRTTSNLNDPQYPGAGWSYDPVSKLFSGPTPAPDE